MSYASISSNLIRSHYYYVQSKSRRRVDINNRHNRILKTDGILVLLANARILVQPAEDLLMPHETVLVANDPAHTVSTQPSLKR